MTTNLFDLTGKTAVVTGTSRGIGKAIAMGFANAGARVAGCARSEDGAEVTAREIREAGGQANMLKIANFLIEKERKAKAKG